MSKRTIHSISDSSSARRIADAHGYGGSPSRKIAPGVFSFTSGGRAGGFVVLLDKVDHRGVVDAIKDCMPRKVGRIAYTKSGSAKGRFMLLMQEDIPADAPSREYIVLNQEIEFCILALLTTPEQLEKAYEHLVDGEISATAVDCLKANFSDLASREECLSAQVTHNNHAAECV